jgi:hypothetical protein
METMSEQVPCSIYTNKNTTNESIQGPRELTIFDPEAIGPIYGFSSKARKGPFYGAMQQSLHTTRDHDFHKQRRKVWDLAFKQSRNQVSQYVNRFEANKHQHLQIMGQRSKNSQTRFLLGLRTVKANQSHLTIYVFIIVMML